MINRSGIIENRGGGGIFVLYLAEGDASHPSGTEGGAQWRDAGLIGSGPDADDRNPSLETLFSGAETSTFLLGRGSIFSIWLLPGRSSPVQPHSQRTLAVHISNVITFWDLGAANWIDYPALNQSALITFAPYCSAKHIAARDCE